MKKEKINSLLFLYYSKINKKDVGGSGFRMWRAVDLLKNKCKLTVVVNYIPNWNIINSNYKTNISDNDVKVVIVKQQTLFQRFLSCFACYGPINKKIYEEANKNDLCLCFSNFGHFGVHGIHFLMGYDIFNVIGIKFFNPHFWSNSRSCFKDSINKIIRIRAHKFLFFIKKILKRDYRFLRLCSKNGDVLIANSNWMASFFKPYHYPVKILYPPVVSEFSRIPPLLERNEDFVCIGRIHEVKKIEEIIHIVETVRSESKKDFKLRIAGYFNDSPYAKYIKCLANTRPWIVLEGVVTGNQKIELLTKCRYAVHACNIEAFGISVAEYIKSGCIPFVPSTGGSAEIVGRSELQFQDNVDAVKKIMSFLNKTDEEKSEVQRELLERGKMFDIKKWDMDFIAIINEELTKKGGAPIVLNSVD